MNAHVEDTSDNNMEGINDSDMEGTNNNNMEGINDSGSSIILLHLSKCNAP